MKTNSIVKEIALTGILTSLSIVFSVFAKIPIGISTIHFASVIILIMPIVLRYRFSLIGSLTSVFFIDLFSGFIQYVWISLVAYASGVSIIHLFLKKNFKFNYEISIILASISITLIYSFTLWILIDKASTINELMVDGIQFGITIPICILLNYFIKKSGKFL